MALGGGLFVGGVVVDEEFCRTFQRGAEWLSCMTDAHSCVSLLLGLKVPPHIVQAIVGHADLNVTMIYAHTSLEEKREALRKLEGALRLRGATAAVVATAGR